MKAKSMGVILPILDVAKPGFGLLADKDAGT
jgi:hypothetical protein